jgi:glyoxylase-like metal-dependent hydrolase (beta-lactamase superfamily II)
MLALAAAAFAWALYLQGQQPAAVPLNVLKLDPDLWVIEGTSNGASDAGNIIIYATGEGVVLVDDRFDENFPQVMAAVKSVTSQPIRYVVNTHHHGDHTGGNAKLLAANIEIAAHANARKHMVTANMPGQPRIVFSTEASIFLGGKEVRMLYFGRGHTDGDITVYIPARKTVHLGDLMAGTRGVTNPVMDYANGGGISGWPETLDGTLKLDIDHVVPGHGTPGVKSDLLAHRNKVDRIRARVRKLLGEKKSKEELTKALIDEFDYKPINLRALGDLMAELRP